MKTLAALAQRLHLPRIFAGVGDRPAPVNPAIQELLRLTDVCGENCRQIEYNRSPLSPDELIEVNLHTYHLLAQLDDDPLAWRAIQQAQSDLQYRSVAQGKEYVLMVYHQLDDGQPELSPWALEALKIIAKIATSKETGDMPEAEALRGFISGLDVRGQHMQAIVSFVELDQFTRQRLKAWPSSATVFKHDAV